MKQIARSVAFSLLGFAWPVVISLIATPAILKGLGETGYGIWSLVNNVLGYFFILNSLQTAGTKYLAEYLAIQDYKKTQSLLGTSLVFNIGVGAVGGVMIYSLAHSLAMNVFDIPNELQSQSIIAFQLTGLGFCISTIGWWGTSILSGLQRYDWLTGIAVFSNTLSILGSLITVLLGWGVIGIVTVNLLALTLSAGIYVWCAHQLLPQESKRLTFEWQMLRRILGYGFYSSAQMVFGVIATQMDRTILGMWIGTAAVAIYSVPLSVANRIHQLCAKALEVIFPLVSRLEAQQRNDQLKRLFLRALNLNMVLVIIMTVPLLVLASEVLTYWISKEFAEQASLVFRLLIIAYGLLALNVVMAAIVAGLGHPEINTLFTLALGMANLLGYFLFMPYWGVNGAGIASVFGSLVAVPGYLWYVNHRFLKVNWSEIVGSAVVRPFIAGIILAFILYFMRPLILNGFSLLATLIASAIVYIGTTLLLNIWQPDELLLIVQFWNKIRSYYKPVEVPH